MKLASSKDAPFGGNRLDVVRGRADGHPRSLRSSAIDITGLGPGVFWLRPEVLPLSSLDFGFRARVGPRAKGLCFTTHVYLALVKTATFGSKRK
jgi:hypothetical protein